MSNTNEDGSSQPQTYDDNAPLWKYVTRNESSGVRGGGNVSFKCNYCKEDFTGSYSRVKCHLLKIKGGGIRLCNKVTQRNLLEMRKVVDEAEVRVKNAKARTVSLPTTSSKVGSSSATPFDLEFDTLGSTMDSGLNQKKRKGAAGFIDENFHMAHRQNLDALIARMFYTSGLSFNLARNPYYVEAFTYACKYPIPGYKPPGYNPLRTTLLQREKSHIELKLNPIMNSWREKGASVCSDGWSDSQRRPLINIMAACESGPMFLKAVNCEGETKNAQFIATLLDECIREIGPQYVVQVITDNASACKAAGHILEAKYRHIFWTPCVVHTLNLALKNICTPTASPSNDVWGQCIWIADVCDEFSAIKNFIMNHQMALAIFTSYSKLKLLAIADTRFASMIVMLRRFKEVKRDLQRMVVSEEWDSYQEDCLEKARSIKEKILNDKLWCDLEYILSFTSPIYSMLRRCDTDIPCLHMVYEYWDCMIENVKNAIYKKEKKELDEKSEFFDVVYEVLVQRWTKSSTPLHCLAHSLNPRYYSNEWLDRGPNRVAPHKDKEISIERKKCFERYFANSVERRSVNEEYAAFSTNLDDFSNSDAMGDRFDMEPLKWWVVHGASAPTLQTLALKLLGQPCSSSCCERNWSTYKFIHSLRRNRIAPQRAEDLVYVHNNLRLLSRRTDLYKKGYFKMWDVGGDEFDSLSLERAGVLEIANLSLDEPDLEAVIFTNDDDEVQEEIFTEI